MPPVFGPVSPSPTRLKSCAGSSGTADCPSVTTKSDTSGPARYSSITTRPHSAACRSAAARSSVTTTPLPAARPSFLTTYGAPKSSSAAATSSGVVQAYARAVGTCAAVMISLANALEPSSCAASARRAEDRDALGAYGVGDPGDQRRLGPDHHQVGADLDGQGDHRLRVGRVDVPQVRDGGDARVARGGDQLLDVGVGGQAQRKRMLTTTATQEKYAHPAILRTPTPPLPTGSHPALTSIMAL